MTGAFSRPVPYCFASSLRSPDIRDAPGAFSFAGLPGLFCRSRPCCCPMARPPARDCARYEAFQADRWILLPDRFELPQEPAPERLRGCFDSCAIEPRSTAVPY